jgi:hypothetical protein
MSMYLPAIVGATLVCVGLSAAMPASRRPLMVVVVLLVAATVFAPDIALGIRVLGAMLTVIIAVACVRQLRRS